MVMPAKQHIKVFLYTFYRKILLHKFYRILSASNGLSKCCLVIILGDPIAVKYADFHSIQVVLNASCSIMQKNWGTGKF